MPNSLINFLDSMMIAMEADDITTQAAEDTRSAIGGRNMSTQEDGPKEDLTNTDDIFGQNPTDDSESQNPDDTSDQTEDIFGQTDDNQASEDPNLTDTPDEGQADPAEKQDTDLLFAKKNTIRDNLAQLYTIILGNIDSLTASLNNLNDAASLKVTNAVLTHLRNCKQYIYKTLTEDIATIEYDEFLRRYVTIKRVFDICTRMMEVHFQNRPEDKK